MARAYAIGFPERSPRQTRGGIPEKETYTMDDMVYSSSTVPLPGAVWLGLVLLGGLGVTRRLRRTRA